MSEVSSKQGVTENILKCRDVNSLEYIYKTQKESGEKRYKMNGQVMTLKQGCFILRVFLKLRRREELGLKRYEMNGQHDMIYLKKCIDF